MGPAATVIQRLTCGHVADHLHFTPPLTAQLINYNNYINSWHLLSDPIYQFCPENLTPHQNHMKQALGLRKPKPKEVLHVPQALARELRSTWPQGSHPGPLTYCACCWNASEDLCVLIQSLLLLCCVALGKMLNFSGP